MKGRIQLIVFFLTLSSVMHGQSKCEEVTLDVKIKKQFDSFSQKQFEELRNNKDINVYTAFNLAEYYRDKADTNYFFWYHKFIEASGAKSADFRNNNLLIMLATAHYYINDYKVAQDYFRKADVYEYRYRCTEHYTKLIKAKLK